MKQPPDLAATLDKVLAAAFLQEPSESEESAPDARSARAALARMRSAPMLLSALDQELPEPSEPSTDIRDKVFQAGIVLKDAQHYRGLRAATLASDSLDRYVAYYKYRGLMLGVVAIIQALVIFEPSNAGERSSPLYGLVSGPMSTWLMASIEGCLLTIVLADMVLKARALGISAYFSWGWVMARALRLHSVYRHAKHAARTFSVSVDSPRMRAASAHNNSLRFGGIDTLGSTRSLFTDAPQGSAAQAAQMPHFLVEKNHMWDMLKCMLWVVLVMDWLCWMLLPSWHRYARVLRPLLLVCYTSELRRWVYLLIRVAPQMLLLVVFMGLVMMCWAAAGVILFGPDSKHWSPANRYDEFFSALLSVFVLTTTESYPTVMQEATDALGGWKPGYRMFHISMLIVAIFVLVNLVIPTFYRAFKQRRWDLALYMHITQRRSLLAAFKMLRDPITNLIPFDTLLRVVQQVRPDLLTGEYKDEASFCAAVQLIVIDLQAKAPDAAPEDRVSSHADADDLPPVPQLQVPELKARRRSSISRALRVLEASTSQRTDVAEYTAHAEPEPEVRMPTKLRRSSVPPFLADMQAQLDTVPEVPSAQCTQQPGMQPPPLLRGGLGSTLHSASRPPVPSWPSLPPSPVTAMVTANPLIPRPVPQPAPRPAPRPAPASADAALTAAHRAKSVNTRARGMSVRSMNQEQLEKQLKKLRLQTSAPASTTNDASQGSLLNSRDDSSSPLSEHTGLAVPDTQELGQSALPHSTMQSDGAPDLNSVTLLQFFNLMPALQRTYKRVSQQDFVAGRTAILGAPAAVRALLCITPCTGVLGIMVVPGHLSIGLGIVVIGLALTVVEKIMYRNWLGARTFRRSRAEMLDIVVVAAAVLCYIAAVVTTCDEGRCAWYKYWRSATWYRIFMLLVCSRFLRLLALIGPFRDIVQAVVSVTRILAIAGTLLFMLMFVYAVIGMEMFGRATGPDSCIARGPHGCPGYPDYANPAVRYDTFGSVLLLLFQVLSTSNWHDVMFATQWATGATVQTPLYFVSFYIIAVTFLFNLVVTVFIDSFDNAHARTRGKRFIRDCLTLHGVDVYWKLKFKAPASSLATMLDNEQEQQAMARAIEQLSGSFMPGIKQRRRTDSYQVDSTPSTPARRMSIKKRITKALRRPSIDDQPRSMPPAGPPVALRSIRGLGMAAAPPALNPARQASRSLELPSMRVQPGLAMARRGPPASVRP